MPELLRRVIWRRLDRPGMEHCELQCLAADRGWLLRGEVIVVIDDEPAWLGYSVELRGDWTTQRVAVRHARGVETVAEMLLEVDDEHRWHLGRWYAGEAMPPLQPVPAFEGLVDVDLGFTSATNMLPIRRLTPAVGEAVEVTAAWVRFPELTVEPLPQRYVRLDERRYRYESSGGAFVAELEVDDLGLVVSYEGGWARVAEAKRP